MLKINRREIGGCKIGNVKLSGCENSKCKIMRIKKQLVQTHKNKSVSAKQ